MRDDLDVTKERVIREASRRAGVLREYNDCHVPAGSPAGGQFCGKSGRLPGDSAPRDNRMRDRSQPYGSPMNPRIEHGRPKEPPKEGPALWTARTTRGKPAVPPSTKYREESPSFGTLPTEAPSLRKTPTDPELLAKANLSDLANVIRRDWGPKVNFAAKPYLSALASLNDISDMYGADDAKSIVAYFLSNATSWRGPVAKAVKAELNFRLTGKRPKAPGPPRQRKMGVEAYVAARRRGSNARAEKYGISEKEGFEAWAKHVRKQVYGNNPPPLEEAAADLDRMGETIIREASAKAGVLREYNQCHNPSGPGGGRFCGKGGSNAPRGTGPRGPRKEDLDKMQRRRVGPPTYDDPTPGPVPGSPIRRTSTEIGYDEPSPKYGKPTKKARTTASDYLNQMMDYGGTPTRRGDVIADMKKQGASQAMIDRYMQGSEAGAQARAKAAFRARQATQGDGRGGKAKYLKSRDMSWAKAVRDNFDKGVAQTSGQKHVADLRAKFAQGKDPSKMSVDELKSYIDKLAPAARRENKKADAAERRLARLRAQIRRHP